MSNFLYCYINCINFLNQWQFMSLTLSFPGGILVRLWNMFLFPQPMTVYVSDLFVPRWNSSLTLAVNIQTPKPKTNCSSLFPTWSCFVFCLEYGSMFSCLLTFNIQELHRSNICSVHTIHNIRFQTPTLYILSQIIPIWHLTMP